MAVDRDLFVRLYREGLTAEKIAERCRCHPSYVSTLANRLGLPPLRDRPAPVLSARPPSAVGADTHPVVATGGRYAALAGYATAAGISMAEAQRQWHRHRSSAARAMQ